MALRKQSGGTLSLVIISTFVLVLIGSCFFLIAKIIGGAREAQHATDSGGLNVAKQAIKNPGYTLMNSVANGDEDNFAQLVDPQTGQVDLEVYNRLVGRSLLVAINASVDGNATGLTNANTLMRVLEGNNGIGQKLGNQLGVGSGGGPTLGNFFSNLAGQNSTRMLGQGNLAQQGVTAAYMEQRRAQDVGATNLLAPLPQQMPYIDTSSDQRYTFNQQWLTTDARTGQTYVRGYTAMNINSIAMPAVGVPVQPRHQPRLASAADFEAMRAAPVAGVNVPPNAFRSAAATAEERSRGNLNTIACALVGIVDAANNKEFRPAIPDGYIRILNLSGNPVPAGTNPAAFNLFDDELDPAIGVKVGGQGPGKHMTSTDGLLERWDNYNRAKQADPNTTVPQPPLTDLYQADGRPATVQTAEQIRLSNPGSPDTVCTDRNTYQPLSQPGFPPENPECRSLLDSGAMDAAFSQDGPYTQNAGPSDDLMAVEEVKCRVIDRFNEPGGISTAIPRVTGMRLWAAPGPGGGRPWSAGSGRPRCQVSEDGTLLELVWQAARGNNPQGAVESVRKFIHQRVMQMNPNVQAIKIDELIGYPIGGGRSSNRNGNLLPLSDAPYLIYVNPSTQMPMLSQTFNTTPLAWRNTPPDGTPGGNNNQWRFATQYDNMETGTMGIVNPRYEADIHDRLFQCQSGECRAEDLALITPSCGYRNILGEVRLQNRVVSFSNGGSLGQSPQFSCPN